MKKRLLAVFVCVLVLIYPMAVFGLGDNPPQVPAEPDIVKVDLSSSSHMEGIVKSVTVTVDTSNITDGTAITTQFVHSDGTSSVTGVSLASGTVSENVAVLNLSIPAGVSAGSYKIKVNISSLNIFDNSSIYTIIGGAQAKITSVTSNAVSHITGTQQTVGVTIVTENASNGTSTSVTLVEDNGSAVNGVTAAVGTINSNNASLELLIPASVPAGSYKLKAAVSNAINDSTVYTVIPNSNDPAILSVLLSSSSKYEGTNSTLTVTLNTQLVSEGVDVRVSLLDADGEEVVEVSHGTSVISSNSSSVQLEIPEIIPIGTYYIQAQVISPELVHNSTVYKVIQPSPVIDIISTEGANLYEGSISGDMVISGGNFSSTLDNNTVEIIDVGSGEVVATVVPSEANGNSLIAAIPEELNEGTYTVRVTVGSKSAISSVTFEISTQITTSTPTSTPIQTSTPTPTPGEDGDTGGTAGTGNTGGTADSVDTSPTPTGLTVPDKTITSIDKAAMESKIAEISVGEAKVIRFDLAESKTGNKLVLAAEAVNLILQEKVDLIVTSSQVKLEIPFIVMNSYIGSQVEVNLTLVENSVLETIPGNSMNNLTRSGHVYEIQLVAVSGTTQTTVTKFAGKVKIELGVNGIDITKANTKKLAVYYLDEVTMTWKFVGGRYDADTGKVTAKTNHFTKFTVMEYNKSFADVSSTSWAREYIELLAARNITDGIDENNFDPKGVVTRAQFATFLVKALGIETAEYTGKFSDVPNGKWYSLHVEAAERLGLVSGLGGGIFDPNANITREQMAVMVMNGYKYVKGTDIAGEAQKATVKFTDEGKFNSWGKDAVYAAQANGIIDGMPGNVYNPKENAKREQAARVIIGLLELLSEI